MTEGLRVVHQRGFAGASVRDIVKAAGVPQGSFTNHFQSKEAFALEILDRYFEQTRSRIAATLLNEAMPPLDRLRAYLEADDAAPGGTQNGCLIGNFSIEASAHSEVIRLRLVAIFDEMRAAVAQCLHAAVAAGQLPAATDPLSFADFFLSLMQGATLRAKVERSQAPLRVFKELLFSTMLSHPA